MKAICEDCADVPTRLKRLQASMLRTIQPCQTGIELGKRRRRKAQTKLATIRRCLAEDEKAGGAIGDVFEDRDTVKNQSNADAASALKGTEYDVTGNLVGCPDAGWLDQNLIVMVMSVTGTVHCRERWRCSKPAIRR